LPVGQILPGCLPLINHGGPIAYPAPLSPSP
jgi:hypothetical protein